MAQSMRGFAEHLQDRIYIQAVGYANESVHMRIYMSTFSFSDPYVMVASGRRPAPRPGFTLSLLPRRKPPQRPLLLLPAEGLAGWKRPPGADGRRLGRVGWVDVVTSRSGAFYRAAHPPPRADFLPHFGLSAAVSFSKRCEKLLGFCFHSWRKAEKAPRRRVGLTSALTFALLPARAWQVWALGD